MKKLLSIVLALAIVASCLGLMSIATNDSTNPSPVALKLTSDGDGRFVTCRGVWANDEGFTGTKSVSYKIYNPNEHDITVNFYVQVLHNNGWNGQYNAQAIKIPAKTVKTVTGYATFENGLATVTSGSTSGTYAPSAFFGRFDFGTTVPNGDIIYIQDTRADVTYLYGTPVSNGMASYEAVTEIPAFDKLTGINVEILEDNNGANKYLRNGSLGLGAGDVTVTDTERYVLLRYRVYNLSNSEAKINMFAQTGTSGWSTIKGISYPGNISESSGEQAIPANSSLIFSVKIPVNADNKVVQNDNSTHDLSKTSFRFEVLTDRNLTAGQEFMIQALNDASVGYLTVADANIFDVTSRIYGETAYVEHSPVGVKLEVTNASVNNAGMLVFGTKGIAADGKVFDDCPNYTGDLSVSYIIYNTSSSSLSATLYFSRRGQWDTVSSTTVTVPANSKTMITGKIAVTNGKATIANTQVDASQIRIRFNLNYKNLVNGDVYYIAPAETNIFDPMFYGAASNNGFTRTNVTTLPTNVEFTPVPATEAPTTTEAPSGGGEDGAEAQPTEAPKYIAAKFEEVTPSGNTAKYLCNWGGGKFLEDDATFNGTVTIKYVIYNTAKNNVTVDLVYNNTAGKSASEGPGRTKSVVIEPGKFKEFEISTTFVNGVTTLDAENGYTATLSQLRVRVNYKFAEAQEGNSLIVASATEDENDYIIKSYTNANFTKTMLTKDQLPKAEAVRVPTGITLTTTDEADGSGKLYFTTKTTGGIITNNDIKNGQITKSFKVKNNGQDTIEVKVDIQALVGGSWKNPDGKQSEFVVIEPGKTAIVSWTADVEDGKVTIGDEEVAISKLFAKFSIMGEDGTLPEGTSFTIYFAEGEEGLFANMVGEAKADEGWSSQIIYTAPGATTGDTLPVALIATVALAFVALVVASKKRKEN